jgi:hypothetical protein
VLVAPLCNPSYSGGRDPEDCGSKPAPGQIVQRPYLGRVGGGGGGGGGVEGGGGGPSHKKKGWRSGSRYRS